MGKKLTFEQVNQHIENEGYELLSKEYVNCREKLNIKCDKGHNWFITFHSFKNGGCRCPVCANNQKHTYDYVKDFIKRTKYKLISTEYKNNRGLLSIECLNGHVFDTSFDSFNSGCRCPVCANNQKYTHEYVKEYFLNNGHTLISEEYINNKKKLEIKCPNNHTFNMRFNDFKNGERCPNCVRLRSKQEIELVEFTKKIYNGIIEENNRKIIKNPLTNNFLELDIYLPEIKKAIEFNSKFWHGNSGSIHRDNEKIKQCNEKGISLLVVWYEQWVKDKQGCLDKVKHFVNG